MKGWQVEGDSSSEEEEPMPQKSAFESDEEIQLEQSQVVQEPVYEVEKADVIFDLSQVDPAKVNWFKYIVDKHLN